MLHVTAVVLSFKIVVILALSTTCSVEISWVIWIVIWINAKTSMWWIASAWFSLWGVWFLSSISSQWKTAVSLRIYLLMWIFLWEVFEANSIVSFSAHKVLVNRHMIVIIKFGWAIRCWIIEKALWWTSWSWWLSFFKPLKVLSSHLSVFWDWAESSWCCLSYFKRACLYVLTIVHVESSSCSWCISIIKIIVQGVIIVLSTLTKLILPILCFKCSRNILKSLKTLCS